MKSAKVIVFLTVVILLMGLVLGTSCGGEGPTGVGIQSIVNNGNGTFTVNLSDGTSFTTDNMTGSQGGQGLAGVGIQSVVNNGDGTFTLQMTDASSFTTPNLTGPQGAKGDQGAQGIQGVQGPAGFGWGTPSSYGPYSKDIGTVGHGFQSIPSLNPGDRVEFTFTVAGGNSLLYSVEDPDPNNNTILTGSGGNYVQSGGGAFIAASSGTYRLYFSTGIPTTAVVTIYYTVYPYS